MKQSNIIYSEPSNFFPKGMWEKAEKEVAKERKAAAKKANGAKNAKPANKKANATKKK